MRIIAKKIHVAFHRVAHHQKHQQYLPFTVSHLLQKDYVLTWLFFFCFAGILSTASGVPEQDVCKSWAIFYIYKNVGHLSQRLQGEVQWRYNDCSLKILTGMRNIFHILKVAKILHTHCSGPSEAMLRIPAKQKIIITLLCTCNTYYRKWKVLFIHTFGLLYITHQDDRWSFDEMTL